FLLLSQVTAMPPAGARSTRPDDLGGECLERVPVVWTLAQRDAEPRAAERPELLDHRARLFHRASQIAGALRAGGAATEVALEQRLRARDALGVGPEIEAEVHAAHDRARIPPFGLAPAVEHL